MLGLCLWTENLNLLRLPTELCSERKLMEYYRKCYTVRPNNSRNIRTAMHENFHPKLTRRKKVNKYVV